MHGDPNARAKEAALWWVDQTRAVADLATGVATKDAARRLSAKESFWELALRWAGITGHPLSGWLVAEHLSWISAYADAAFDRDRKRMDAAVAAMMTNIVEQARLHSADSTRFPAEDLKGAMARHTARIAAYLEGLMTWDRPAFEKAWRLVQSSRDELAGLWMRALSIPSAPSADPASSETRQ